MNKPFNNILETIGNTPLIQINKVVKDLPCYVYTKFETTNPGNSIIDLKSLKMIIDARGRNKTNAN